MAKDFSIVKSAALAATTLPAQGAAVVERAARQGANALSRGVLVPLPVLLDVNVLLDARSVERPSFRAVNSYINETVTYERWIMDFVAFAAGYLGIPARRRPARDNSVWDLTPLLAFYFPTTPLRPKELAVFRKLSAGDGVQHVLDAWGRKRATRGWRDLYPQVLDGFRPSSWERGAWVQFSVASGSGWLDERFDHEAARIYFEAANPDPDFSQRRRIDRLRRRQTQHEPNPLTESYEEQALYYGAITTATLAMGEYGTFKIINGSDPRISNPLPVQPPRTVQIHLCRAHAYSGLNRTLPAVAFLNGIQELDGVLVTEVSILQAFSALLFDDWRSALVRLDVRLHAHCGAPSADRDNFGRPGKRWKPSRTSGPMPLPRMIGQFFQRATWLSVKEHDLSWHKDRSGSDWWCLVLLKNELGDFGILPVDSGIIQFAGALSAPRDALPSCISTVVVLDPASRDGTVYDIIPAIGGNLRLSAIPTQRVSRNEDPSFMSLRMRCLDALLAALEVRR